MPGDQRVRPFAAVGQQQRRELGGGVEPAAALLGLGVPPRVRDRRARRRRQRDRQLLVVGGELTARDALGQVQVAEDLLPIRTGTPRKLPIGGCPGGNPAAAG